MNIGTKIKKLREFKNLSQADLATRLDISQAQLCKIESKVEKKDFVLMHKICDFFNVDFQYFLEDKVVNNNVKDNKGQISCENFTVNNYPESLLEVIVKNQEQITSLIEAQNKLIDSLKKT
jgi:transcriptional regulator with XRE-family HTH domain